jgi:pilus assembly protein CpaF
VENPKREFSFSVNVLGMQTLDQVLTKSRGLIREQALSPEAATAKAIDQLAESSHQVLDELELAQLALAQLQGFGQLQPYLDNPEIEELWINQPNELHFFGHKGYQRVELKLSASEIKSLCYRLLSHSKRRVDRLTPFVDASMSDGSRLHIVIPEITQEHWAINIRKFPKANITLSELFDLGALTASQLVRLRYAMQQGESVLIAGATQAGKTTLLSALLRELRPDQRLVSCEDTFEIAVSHPDWVAMQTRPADLEGSHEISLRDLVKQALRMRPARLAIGEVRGAEALDMLVALNSGIPGLCTIHANSASAALQKLLTLPLLAGENITDAFLRPTVKGAFQLVAFCHRDESGKREVKELLEVKDAAI